MMIDDYVFKLMIVRTHNALCYGLVADNKPGALLTGGITITNIKTTGEKHRYEAAHVKKKPITYNIILQLLIIGGLNCLYLLSYQQSWGGRRQRTPRALRHCNRLRTGAPIGLRFSATSLHGNRDTWQYNTDGTVRVRYTGHVGAREE